MKQDVTKEVVKKSAPQAIAVMQPRQSVVDSSDIVVPKIMLAQGLSQSVADNKAKMGDMTNSLTGVVVGGSEKPLTFIPITIKKYWKNFEKVGNKRAFRGVEAFTGANARRPLTEQLPAQGNPSQMAEWSHDLVLDVFGFTEDDVQDPVALPSAISFSRTSYKAGQKVMTHFASLEASEVQVPYYQYMMELSCFKKQNDKGIFYCFEVKPKLEGSRMTKTPEKYYSKIERWSKILNDNSRSIVVDDSDEETEAVSTPIDDSRF
jgi:hypothetical protein